MPIVLTNGKPLSYPFFKIFLFIKFNTSHSTLSKQHGSVLAQFWQCVVCALGLAVVAASSENKINNQLTLKKHTQVHVLSYCPSLMIGKEHTKVNVHGSPTGDFIYTSTKKPYIQS